jgi:hypothetical protein
MMNGGPQSRNRAHRLQRRNRLEGVCRPEEELVHGAPKTTKAAKSNKCAAKEKKPGKRDKAPSRAKGPKS